MKSCDRCGQPAVATMTFDATISIYRKPPGKKVWDLCKPHAFDAAELVEWLASGDSFAYTKTKKKTTVTRLQEVVPE